MVIRVRSIKSRPAAITRLPSSRYLNNPSTTPALRSAGPSDNSHENKDGILNVASTVYGALVSSHNSSHIWCLYSHHGYSVYRYLRLVVNLLLFWTFKPIPIPENPTLYPKDVTVILPTLDGEGPELERTVQSILRNEPKELILVTIDDNLHKAQNLISKKPAADHGRLRCMSVKQANKRRQMARAVPEVTTPIIVFADDDVDWPRKTLQWLLAPFEQPQYGGVVTCQRLRRAENPSCSQRVWNFLGALYLERRNFDCAAMTRVDGGMPCISGRTVAYRTEILKDPAFTSGFTDERWWFDQYQLNADDDNFITRWLLTHGWQNYMQYHPECEVQTTLENNSNFLKQCLRWARSNWRSNITSLVTERYVWR